MSNSLWPHGLYYTVYGILHGVGSLSLFQEIFPTQGLNPGLPHCRLILYQLSHQGNPRILEWVAYPFSRVSSWPRNRTGVSCNSLPTELLGKPLLNKGKWPNTWKLFMGNSCNLTNWLCEVKFFFFKCKVNKVKSSYWTLDNKIIQLTSWSS